MNDAKYQVVRASKFKKGYKFAKKQGKDLSMLARKSIFIISYKKQRPSSPRA